MKTTLSKYAGFCQGVQLAYDKACQAIESAPKPLYMLGDLVHNKDVVEKFEKKGIKIIKSLDQIKSGTLIITAHGISPKTRKLAQQKGVNIIDTTCPFGVIQAHESAKKLEQSGRQVIIVGKKKHREIIGIMGELKKPIIITELDEIKKLNFYSNKPLAVISQTTFKISKFNEITHAIEEKFSNVKVIDTICRSTHERQQDIKNLAQKSDAVIIIGDPKSSNSTELYNTAKEVNDKSYFIANADQFDSAYLKNYKSVSITAGASTPIWIIDQVISKIKTL